MAHLEFYAESGASPLQTHSLTGSSQHRLDKQTEGKREGYETGGKDRIVHGSIR